MILPPDQADPYAEILEPLMTLAYVASHTSRVKLGISVIVVPQRNGVVLAKEQATLDRLCQGRLIVGIGAGWSQAEFEMLGVGERFRHREPYLDETLRLWQHLWTTPETPFQGTYYDMPAAAFGPGPIQQEGPPIWVGGSSVGARRRAGTFGSAWHPVGISASFPSPHRPGPRPNGRRGTKVFGRPPATLKTLEVRGPYVNGQRLR